MLIQDWVILITCQMFFTFFCRLINYPTCSVHKCFPASILLIFACADLMNTFVHRNNLKIIQTTKHAACAKITVQPSDSDKSPCRCCIPVRPELWVGITSQNQQKGIFNEDADMEQTQFVPGDPSSDASASAALLCCDYSAASAGWKHGVHLVYLLLRAGCV